MRCTVFSTMERPRPAPAAAVRAVSPRKKGLVRLVSWSADTPGPWSRMRMVTVVSLNLTVMSTRV
ncbi:hypothetical protein D3C81_1979450 [compost metagenome]